MPLIVKKSAGHIEPVPPGKHVAICFGLIDLGTHENTVFGGEAHKVLVQWELPECRGEYEREGEKVSLPRAISKRYTLSLSEMANLRRDLESWRGREFTAKELKGFDLRMILGTRCQIQIAHETSKDGRIFASVAAIKMLPKGTPCPESTENEIAYFSFEDMGDGPPVMPEFPEWIRDIVSESKEWGELTTVNIRPREAGADPEPDDDCPF